NPRHRRVLVPPGKIVLISTRIAAVARAGLPIRAVAAQLERGESRRLSNLLCSQLVGGDTDVDVRAGGFARVHPGKETRVRTRVVTGSVAESTSVHVRESAQDLEVPFVRRKRLQDHR